MEWRQYGGGVVAVCQLFWVLEAGFCTISKEIFFFLVGGWVWHCEWLFSWPLLWGGLRGESSPALEGLRGYVGAGVFLGSSCYCLMFLL